MAMVHRQLVWVAAVVAGRIRSSRHTTSMHWAFPLLAATYIPYSRSAACKDWNTSALLESASVRVPALNAFEDVMTISFSKMAFAGVITLRGVPFSVNCPSSELSKALRQLGCIHCMNDPGYATGSGGHATGSGGHATGSEGHAIGCNKHATGLVDMQRI